MKVIRLASLIILFILFNIRVRSQDPTIAKLKMELNKATSDSSRFGTLDSLSIYYVFCSENIDSSYFYADKSIKLSISLNDKRHLILSYARMGSYFYFAAKFGAALQVLHKGIALSEQTGFYEYSSFLNLTVAELYAFLNQFKRAKSYLEQAAYYLKFSKDPFYNIPARTYDAFSLNYLFNGEFDSAAISLSKVKEYFTRNTDLVSTDMYFGWVATLKSHFREYEEAKQIALTGIDACKKNDDHQLVDYIYYQYALVLQKTNQLRAAIVQAKLAINAATKINDTYFLVPISKMISEIYEKLGEKDSTLNYLKLNTGYYAQLASARNVSDIETLEFSDQLHAQEAVAQNRLSEEKDKNRSRQFVFAVGLLILVSVSLMMWRSSAIRKKAFVVLSQQKMQIEIQKSKTELTLAELKATQTQLIQSEKMASLGELTAGIAHEIQNPLNFVNNFAEVNAELIDEMEEAMKQGNAEEARTVARDIKENNAKITNHGKRADAIVKGMLQHSRSTTGQKELADINALADEYLRLAYHGLRAKDNSYNATMNTDFDNSIGKINIIPPDIGRVLLNLYNNAFYAVSEKRKSAEAGYEPAVSVSTKKINGKVEIRVKDNGNGIPQKVVDKIFQPFFTTKPTGQGTGLGLSLSYDIIKAHGGGIGVNTKEGEFTEFLVQLSTLHEK
jgi:two-component system, NtrC family, sensor kinase